MCTDGTFINISAIKSLRLDIIDNAIKSLRLDIIDNNVITETRDESLHAETVC